MFGDRRGEEGYALGWAKVVNESNFLNGEKQIRQKTAISHGPSKPDGRQGIEVNRTTRNAAGASSPGCVKMTKPRARSMSRCRTWHI